jgi:hypothetical protein
MKTNFKKTVAMLVLCFTAMAFNKVQAQYSFTLHWCQDYKTGKGIIFVSEVFNVNDTDKGHYAIVERFEEFSKDAAESKGISLNCVNSFIVHTQGPGGRNSSYKYDYSDAKDGKFDYNEVNSKRTKAIAYYKDYFAQEGYQIIYIDLF